MKDDAHKSTLGNANQRIDIMVQIIWDVGHQAYGHKILTGRRSQMHTIRQTGGLSGEPCCLTKHHTHPMRIRGAVIY